MEKGRTKFGAIAVVLLFLVVGAFSWVNAQSVPTKSTEKEDGGVIKVDKLKEIVTDIEEEHCKMTDKELLVL